MLQSLNGLNNSSARLSKMLASRMTPNEITFNAALKAAEKGAQWRLALHLLSSMPTYELES